MAKKKAEIKEVKKPKAKPKTKALTKKKEQELVFAGASSLMGIDTAKLSPAEVLAHKARILAARALGIPPNTVVIMGNQPYIDNHGRKHKLAEYAPEAQFEYDYVQIATDDTMKAIVKCRIVVPDDEKEVKITTKNTEIVRKIRVFCGWVIGECSPQTTRMGTLKGYQNHLAQTRAENRAFEAAFGVRFRKELYEGVAREMHRDSMAEHADGIVRDTSETVKELALQAGDTSAEEAVPLKKQAPLAFNPYENAKIAIGAAKTAAELENIQKRLRGSPHLKTAEINRLLEIINEKLAGN